MKKIKCLALILCIGLLLQSVALPVSATETTAATEAASTITTFPDETAELAFGEACIQKGCRTIEGMVPLAGNDQRLDSAKGVFLYEVNTETVVYSFNPDLKILPNNLTKLVTAMVVLEHCSLDEVVTAGVNINKTGSNVGMKLKVEEQVPVKDLLYGMIMLSGHDAAVALAEHVAGNQQAFVTLMNNWVVQTGCVNTNFSSVHGLDSTSYTTARDMTKIMLKAMENATMMEIMSADEYTMGETNKSEARSKFQTQNYMQDSSVLQDFYDARVICGLQSYADSAGASLVCMADDSDTDEEGNLIQEPGSMRYVAVILGATRTFSEESSWKPKIYGNFNEMTDLLKFGFGSFKINRIVYEGMSLNQFTVAGGECNAVGQAVVDIDSVVPSSAYMSNLYFSYETVDGGLAAPIERDQLLATASVSYRSSILAELEVYSMGEVRAADNTGVTIRSTAVRSDSDDSGLLSVIGTICVIVLGLAAAYLAFNAYMRSRMRARQRKRRAQRRRMR